MSSEWSGSREFAGHLFAKAQIGVLLERELPAQGSIARPELGNHVPLGSVHTKPGTPVVLGRMQQASFSPGFVELVSKHHWPNPHRHQEFSMFSVISCVSFAVL